jgi:hypothetical protein
VWHLFAFLLILCIPSSALALGLSAQRLRNSQGASSRGLALASRRSARQLAFAQPIARAQGSPLAQPQRRSLSQPSQSIAHAKPQPLARPSQPQPQQEPKSVSRAKIVLFVEAFVVAALALALLFALETVWSLHLSLFRPPPPGTNGKLTVL